MLVLTRRIGEVTTLSGGIEVTVLHIRGGQVRLGWIAPAAVHIHRKESWDRDAPQSRTSSRSQPRRTPNRR